jgi:hypothetical protein
MSRDTLSGLVLRGLVAGRDATTTDYHDALRALSDQAELYARHDDETGEALCSLGIELLHAARCRRAPVVPF